MADIKVQKVEKAEDRALPIFQQVDEMLGRMQQRAYELFAGRSFAHGYDVEDWLAAERELIVHASAKTERREEPAKKEPKVLWSEFRSNDVYRRIELSEPIDVAKVSATLSQGLLKIVAEKAVKKVGSA